MTKTDSICCKAMALCEGRHSIPKAVDGAIYPNAIDPKDLDSMFKRAVEVTKGVDHLDLYVTGLSVALAEVIRVCVARATITLTLWHYDRELGDYYPQHLIV